VIMRREREHEAVHNDVKKEPPTGGGSRKGAKIWADGGKGTARMFTGVG